MSTEHKSNDVEKLFAKQKERRTLLWEAARVSLVVIFGVITFLQTAEIGRLRGYIENIEVQPAQAATTQSAQPARATTGLPSQVGGC